MTGLLMVWAGLVAPPQFIVDVALFRGDPLGTREAGTVRVLGRPTLLVTNRRTGALRVGPAANQIALEVTIAPSREPPLRMQLRATVVTTPTASTANAAGFAPSRNEAGVVSGMRLVLGQPTTIRLAADSPTDQTWAVVTVHRYQPGAVVVSPMGPLGHLYESGAR
jgi:hypothetical protein